MLEPLSRLKLQYWYHVLIVLGAAGALASMTVELKGVANAHALLVSLGLISLGIGEWVNHPLQTKLVRPHAYMPGGGYITSHPRHNSAIGIAFDVLGFALVALAIYKIAKAG